jgi:hypothetical protein
VNNLNTTLPDSLKVNWYFTDFPVDWETMTAKKYANHEPVNRDWIMAENIRQRYSEKLIENEKRYKGLIIMNTRHGYGLHLNNENTTAVLMDSLPNKVCNVMFNSMNLTTFTPIQYGKWDRAFAVAGNPNVGFDFAGSPFGTDHFDAFVKTITPCSLNYQDVFTGFIFYKPIEEHIKKNGFPYMLYNFEDTLIRRAECVSVSNAEFWKKYIHSSYRDEIFTETPPYAIYYNLITKIGFSFYIIITWIICGTIYCYGRKKKE